MNYRGRGIGLVVVVLSSIVGLVSARDYAGSWNDGSRLATVECLVDYHTLAIDQSVFVEVPHGDGPSPYPAWEPDLVRTGTGDKLWIGGRFYSDKSPVPGLLLACAYQGWRWAAGPSARERPDLFCWLMTVLSSGGAYVVAVWSIYRIGQLLLLPATSNLLVTFAFAFATVALPYTEHVNNHSLLLGVAAPLFLVLTLLADRVRAGRPVGWLAGLAGSLAGLGYTIDLGAGPVLLAGTGLLVLYRGRSVWTATVFTLAALPWLVLHHTVNYAVGGTFKPANAVPEYFLWPGCSFNPANLTGGWQHPSVGHFVGYAGELLAGKKGFIGHNPALLLLVPALFLLPRRRLAEWPEAALALFWSVGTWLAYAATSNNSSGLCCSVRWFVPLLAPGSYVLAILLREFPDYRLDFLVLSGWGAALAVVMCWYGPWMKHMVPYYWFFQGGILLSWTALNLRRRWRKQSPATTAPAWHADAA
jgi:hypothetical protein